ncbi:hypothetical protein LCGC14_1862160 [marine sediment metagenome]|uniref:Uncharacterized protein n=1 Tax=marine sediment metagenome TaxID=412755 RepID=A0A0F9G774_9ZZZZ
MPVIGADRLAVAGPSARRHGVAGQTSLAPDIIEAILRGDELGGGDQPGEASKRPAGVLAKAAPEEVPRRLTSRIASAARSR